MHVAVGNYWLLAQAGRKKPDSTPDITGDLETKADGIRSLSSLIAAVDQGYSKTDYTKKVKFLGKDSTSDFVFLRIPAHNHEHMGQMIAYSRMIGMRPPWSAAS